MKKVYQKIISPVNGDCLRASIATLLDMSIYQVPNFIEYKSKSWFAGLYDFLNDTGYSYDGMIHNKNYTNLIAPTRECWKEVKWHNPSIITPSKLKKHGGVDGYFYAAVLSPKFFNWKDQGTHAVVIDSDYNIVHDPNPNYKNIRQYPLSNILKYNGIISVTLISKKYH